MRLPLAACQNATLQLERFEREQAYIEHPMMMSAEPCEVVCIVVGRDCGRGGRAQCPTVCPQRQQPGYGYEKRRNTSSIDLMALNFGHGLILDEVLVLRA